MANLTIYLAPLSLVAACMAAIPPVHLTLGGMLYMCSMHPLMLLNVVYVPRNVVYVPRNVVYVSP
jgi:hypothetical protein